MKIGGANAHGARATVDVTSTTDADERSSKRADDAEHPLFAELVAVIEAAGRTVVDRAVEMPSFTLASGDAGQETVETDKTKKTVATVATVETVETVETVMEVVGSERVSLLSGVQAGELDAPFSQDVDDLDDVGEPTRAVVKDAADALEMNDASDVQDLRDTMRANVAPIDAARAPVPAEEGSRAVPTAAPTPLQAAITLASQVASLSLDLVPAPNAATAAHAADPTHAPTRARQVDATRHTTVTVVPGPNNEASVELVHPTLGAIKLALVVDNGAMVVRALTATPAAARALLASEGELRKSLGAQGMKLVGFEAEPVSRDGRGKKRRGGARKNHFDMEA